MRIVVTGGAGFIGANLVRHLTACDDIESVTVVDDLSTGSVDNLAGVHNVRLLEGSILDSELLDDACADATAIVHLAARPSVPRSLNDPVASHEVNASGTVCVLDAARRASGAHVIVASSSSVYGANPTLPKAEHLAPMPLSPYAASKLATEAYALSYGASFGLPVLPFRFFNVFGPLQAPGHAYAAVIPSFLDAALTGQPLTVHGDGQQSRDFTYVGTVVSILTDAVRRRVTSETPVNLAFGLRLTLLEVINTIEQLIGSSVEVEHTEPRPGDVRHSQADQSRLTELFPDATPVRFPEGLERTIEWFRLRADASRALGAPVAAGRSQTTESAVAH